MGFNSGFKGLIMHRENIAYVTSAPACIMVLCKSMTIGAESLRS